MRKILFSVFTCLTLLAGSANADTVLLQHSFGSDVANDVGSVVGFGNGTGSNVVTDATTGNLSFDFEDSPGVPGGVPTYGFASSAAVDASGFVNGFQVDWTVDSAVNGLGSTGGTANGWFFGVSTSAVLYNQAGSGAAPLSFGFVLEDAGAAPAVVERRNRVSVLGSDPTTASVDDGFSVSLTVRPDNTWTVSTSGLDADLSGTGTLEDVTFTTLASSLFANTTYQAAATSGGSASVNYGNVTVTGLAIPEPSTALFGAFGLLGTLVRRRRS